MDLNTIGLLVFLGGALAAVIWFGLDLFRDRMARRKRGSSKQKHHEAVIQREAVAQAEKDRVRKKGFTKPTWLDRSTDENRERRKDVEARTYAQPETVSTSMFWSGDYSEPQQEQGHTHYDPPQEHHSSYTDHGFGGGGDFGGGGTSSDWGGSSDSGSSYDSGSSDTSSYGGD